MNRAAIIIPFRDSFKNNERYKQLEILSNKINEICLLHNQQYKIFVIHQSDEQLFNKSYLMNIGAKLAMDYDYFILHDVDHIPATINDNIYCQREYSGCLVKEGIEIFPDDTNYFGGVVYIKKEDYLSINGFSNYFWGWGWEDGAVLERLKNAKITTKRGLLKFNVLHHKGEHRYLGNTNFINNAIVYNVINTKLNDGYDNLLFDILNENVSTNLNMTIYNVKIPSPQYDITKIFNKDQLSLLIGIYNEDLVRATIELYSK